MSVFLQQKFKSGVSHTVSDCWVYVRVEQHIVTQHIIFNRCFKTRWFKVGSVCISPCLSLPLYIPLSLSVIYTYIHKYIYTEVAQLPGNSSSPTSFRTVFVFSCRQHHITLTHYSNKPAVWTESSVPKVALFVYVLDKNVSCFFS